MKIFCFLIYLISKLFIILRKLKIKEPTKTLKPAEDDITIPTQNPNELDELEIFDDIPDWGSGLIDYNVLESLRLTGKQDPSIQEEDIEDSFKGSYIQTRSRHSEPTELIKAAGKREFESQNLPKREEEIKAKSPEEKNIDQKEKSGVFDTVIDSEGDVVIENESYNSQNKSFKTQSLRTQSKKLKNSFEPLVSTSIVKSSLFLLFNSFIFFCD